MTHNVTYNMTYNVADDELVSEYFLLMVQMEKSMTDAQFGYSLKGI